MLPDTAEGASLMGRLVGKWRNRAKEVMPDLGQFVSMQASQLASCPATPERMAPGYYRRALRWLHYRAKIAFRVYAGLPSRADCVL